MRIVVFCIFTLLLSPLALAQTSQPAEQRENRLPGIHVDVPNHRVRVECEMLGIDAPLEFLCVRNGTNEHESVLRSAARPSQVHFALIMIGLGTGEPVHFDEQQKKWFPPHGGAIEISAEFVKDGKKLVVPASTLMREIKSQKPMPDHPWIFAGSKVMEDGTYAADVTGYVVSVVNFELSMIDIPELASNANETLMWQIDKAVAPTPGSKVTLIFEPAKSNPSTLPTSRASALPGDAGIDIQTVKVSSSGRIEHAEQALSEKELVDRLKKMQKSRPVRVRLAANDPHGDPVMLLAASLKASGIAVEAIEQARSPENLGLADLLKTLRQQRGDLDQKIAEVEHQLRESDDKR